MINLDNLVITYQKTRDEAVLRLIQKRVSPYIYSRSWFWSLLPIDREYIAEELVTLKLLECLGMYDSTRNSSFFNYYAHCVYNFVGNFIKSQNRQKRYTKGIISLDESPHISRSNIRDEIYNADIILELKKRLDKQAARYLELLLSGAKPWEALCTLGFKRVSSIKWHIRKYRVKIQDAYKQVMKDKI